MIFAKTEHASNYVPFIHIFWPINEELSLTICRLSVVVWAFCNPLVVKRQCLWCQPSDMEHHLQARRR